MPEPLREADVRKVAKLARLALTDEEIHAERGRLARVLDYVEQLQKLDLSNVEPMSTPLVMNGPLAADEPSGMLSRETALGMAPETDGDYIKVPKVVGDGGGA